MTKHIACPRLKLLRDQALEAIRAARAVAVDDHNVVGSRRLRTAYSSVHLAGHEAAPLLILGLAAVDLIPCLNARDAFHIHPDHDTHVRHSLFIFSKINSRRAPACRGASSIPLRACSLI